MRIPLAPGDHCATQGARRVRVVGEPPVDVGDHRGGAVVAHVPQRHQGGAHAGVQEAPSQPHELVAARHHPEARAAPADRHQIGVEAQTVEVEH